MTKKPSSADAKREAEERNPPPSEPEAPTPATFQKLAGLGCTIDQAAASLGMPTGEFIELLKRDDFRTAWESGPAAADVMVLEALFQNATAGNVDAIKFWLTNRHPDQWTANNRKRTTPADQAPPGSQQAASEPPGDVPSEPPSELQHENPLTGLKLRMAE